MPVAQDEPLHRHPRHSGHGETHDQAPAITDTGLGISYPSIGRVKPRHAREIAASSWTVGAETMDRGYTVYRGWRQHLGPLGVKKARIQAGWSRTERERGVYDWAWLDEIVNDMVAQGVEPWVNLSYGNPLYAAGGGTTLFGAVPTSDEALEGWTRWVDAMVARYGHVVDEWEVWNEPNYRIPPADYTRLLIRSAETVRARQPKAKILALALGSGVDVAYADSVLRRVRAEGKLALIDELTFHRHQFNPENYAPVDALRALGWSYAPHITIRQTESGAPSDRRQRYALNGYDWTEVTQAKWNLRRLLGDLGRDIPSSIFGIIDMRYPDDLNTKGLLAANPDGTVARAKEAYHAVQHLTSIFDHTLERIPSYAYTASSTDTALAVFGYRKKGSDEQVVTVWRGGATPGNTNEKTPVDFIFAAGKFTDPVYVDLRTGEVYDILSSSWSRSGTHYRFTGIPVYDSPVLIADRSTIPVQPGS